MRGIRVVTDTRKKHASIGTSIDRFIRWGRRGRNLSVLSAHMVVIGGI